MAGSRRGVIASGEDQFAAAEGCKGDLDAAFGKTRRLSKRSYTRGDWFPFLPRRLAVKMQINEIRGGLLIVAN